MAKRKIEVENAVSPGHVQSVDADKYEATRDAYMSVLIREAPGMTPAEIKSALTPKLSQDLFPGGATAGWWAKCVQLDLEAKGIIVRGPGSPVRLRKA
ncbi:DUF6958 family protein [Brevundimonas sp. SL161]|uniref:DUF6958 family protein n=1 Tax=Brevundimonas sp. SL161 TaxID=2804613 RepID=UPI003CF7D4D4